MNIKLKLSLQFTLLVSIILFFFAALVYYFYYESQLGKFRENLTDTARNSAVLLINVVEVDSTLLKKIQQSTSSWEDEEIVITDTLFRVIYSNNPDYLTQEVMRQNYSQGNNSFFTVSEKDGVFYRHHFRNQTWYVYAMGYDTARIENLKELLEVLLWSIGISVVFSVYLSYIFSRRAIFPITNLVKRIKSINSSKLNDRLDEGNRKDEIAQLAITFNEMLTDLEIAFSNQRDFISNASHELHTPLTLMLVESEYLLSRERTPAEYRTHVAVLMDDIRQLNSLLNSLLEMAHLNRETGIRFTEVRIDEVVFSSIQKIKEKFEGRKIIPKIRYPEDDSGLMVKGNAGLLLITFNNLIENACKFSEADVTVEFEVTDTKIIITISDQGIGIPSGQVTEVLSPFKRGTNAKFKGGYGIGLSLVSKILDIHKVPFHITSHENQGTMVRLEFERYG